MSKYTKPTVQSISKTVSEYRSICKMLDAIVEEYFEKTYEDWQHFTGWAFSDDCKNIRMSYKHYMYNGYYEDIETDEEIAPLEEIIKMIKIE